MKKIPSFLCADKEKVGMGEGENKKRRKPEKAAGS
jgi:hypothetical protein